MLPIRLALLAMAACGSQVATVDDSTRGDATTGAATEGTSSGDATVDDTGDGPVPPQLDCQTDPIDLAAPRWESVVTPEQPGLGAEDFVVLPGGDVIAIVGSTRIVRWSGTGEEVWALDAVEEQWWNGLAATATGEVIVTGNVGDGVDGPAHLQLLRLSAGGERLAERLHDDAPGMGQAPWRVAVTASGDVIVMVFWLETESWWLQRYDPSLERVWSVELEPGRVYLGLASDPAGDHALVASFVLDPSSETGVYVWNGRLDDHGLAGTVQWSADFQLTVDNQPGLELAVGDRIYLLTDGIFTSPSYLFAWDFDGEPSFARVSSDADPFRAMHSLSASPCGGAYVGGRAAVEGAGTRAALWHVDADGVEAPATILLEDPPLEGSRYDAVDRVRVSALDDLVVRGRLAPLPEGELSIEWLRGY